MSIYCKDESIKVAIGSIETENIGCYILVLLSSFCVFFVFVYAIYSGQLLYCIYMSYSFKNNNNHSKKMPYNLFVCKYFVKICQNISI